MTVSSCTSYCSGLGYTYAGVEYGYQVSRSWYGRPADPFQCFCGNSLDSSKAISSSSCNYACQGSSSQTCGGFYAAGVYQLKATSTTSSSSSSSPTATASSSASSLGCYTDSGNPRLLTGPEKDYSGSLTPAICQSYCGSAGYTYAGVEYGYQVSLAIPTPPTSPADSASAGVAIRTTRRKRPATRRAHTSAPATAARSAAGHTSSTCTSRPMSPRRPLRPPRSPPPRTPLPPASSRPTPRWPRRSALPPPPAVGPRRSTRIRWSAT